MAHYAYKCFVQDIDYEKYKQLVVKFEKEQDREHDGDSNYNGDNWIIAEMWVKELRERLAVALSHVPHSSDCLVNYGDGYTCDCYKADL